MNHERVARAQSLASAKWAAGRAIYKRLVSYAPIIVIVSAYWAGFIFIASGLAVSILVAALWSVYVACSTRKQYACIHCGAS